MTLERIAKVIAARSPYSRRDAEHLIAQGRVRLGEEIIAHPSHKIAMEDASLAIDHRLLPLAPSPKIWLFHKPTGTLTTAHDPQGRPTIFSLLPPHLQGMMTIGRLDMQSEGLLLLTNHAPLKAHLEHPDQAMERRYWVRVYGTINTRMLEEIRHGLLLDGIHYRPVDIVIDSQSGENSWLHFTLREGKNREIRHLCTALGVQVNRLIRAGYGPFTLDDMPHNSWKEAPGDLVTSLIKRNAL
jgi:23S rRNA pseudouridine2605 synthase